MKKISILVLTTLVLVTFTQAQNSSPEVLEAGKKVDEAFDQNLKRWTSERVVPVMFSENVFIEFWKTYDRTVKVSIGLLPVDRKGGDLLRSDPSARIVDGIGDEAIAWGYAETRITFHRGRFDVSISSEVDLNLLSRDRKANEAMSNTEAAATSRLMACFVNLALNGDLKRGKPIPREGFLQRPCEQELMYKRLFGDEILNQLKNRY